MMLERIAFRPTVFLVLIVIMAVLFLIASESNHHYSRQTTRSILDKNLRRSNVNDSCVYPTLQGKNTLFASYPSAGMKVFWQQINLLSGSIDVVQDIDYGDNKRSPLPPASTSNHDKPLFIHTNYPHYEGAWSYGSKMDQVILIVQNPRVAIPLFYHKESTSKNMKQKKNYSSWLATKLNNYYGYIFPRNNNYYHWVAWRDDRLENELNLWAWQIDYYLENGSKYWMELNSSGEGNSDGVWPSRFYNEPKTPWTKDPHCNKDLDSCFPKAVLFYETFQDPKEGPDALKKVAKELFLSENHHDELDDNSFTCLWQKANMTKRNDQLISNTDLILSKYPFLLKQLTQIQEKLQFMKTKYCTSGNSGGDSTPITRDLCTHLTSYWEDLHSEITRLKVPRKSFNPKYELSLINLIIGSD